MNIFKLLGIVSIDTSDANRSLDNITGKAEKSGSRLGGIFSKAGRAVGVGVAAGAATAATALAGIAIAGTRAAIDFEAGMREVFTLLPQLSAESRDKMSADVQAFAAEAGVLPDEVVPALYQAISAGVPQDNVFEFLRVANAAAVGGVTDLETAVDGITSVVNAYGSDVISAAEASDLMFTAVKLGKTTFGELSASLFNVIPQASALGVEFGDVTAALAAMTAQGTPTSVATTQMRQLFVELSKAGGDASDTFTQLAGKTFKEFIASGGNVQTALQLMEKHAQDTGVGVNDLFGSVEAGNAALALTGKGTEAFGNALAEMGDSAGATQAAFETMQASNAQQMKKIRANIAVVLIQLGDQFLPILSKLLDWFVRQLPAIQGMVQTAFNAIGRAIDFVSESVVPRLSRVFGDVGDNSGTLKATLSRVWGEIKDFLSATFDALVALWEVVLKPVWGAIEPFVVGVFRGIGSAVGATLRALTATMQAFTAFLRGDWEGAFNAMSSAILYIWVGLKETTGRLMAGLRDTLLNIMGALPGEMAEIGKNIVQGLANGITSALNIVTDAAESVGNSVKNTLRRILGIESPSKVTERYGVYLLEGLSKGLKSDKALKELEDATLEAAGRVVSAVQQGLTPAADALEYLNPLADQLREQLALKYAAGDLAGYDLVLGKLVSVEGAIKAIIGLTDPLAEARAWTGRLASEVEEGFKKPGEAIDLLTPKLIQLRQDLANAYGEQDLEEYNLVLGKIELIEAALGRISEVTIPAPNLDMPYLPGASNSSVARDLAEADRIRADTERAEREFCARGGS